MTLTNHVVCSMAVALLTLSACHTDRTTGQEPSTTPTEDSLTRPTIKQIAARTIQDTTTYRGAVYAYDITRTPATDLPTIIDEDGQVYADNKISLQITQHGETRMAYTYTKKDFIKFLPTETQDKYLLEGIVFYQSNVNEMQFIASLSYPESDMYISILLNVDTQGHVTMSKSEALELE